MEISLIGGKAAVFSHIFCGSNHICETKGREEAQSKEGKGKMADERKGLMKSRKVRSELRQCKNRRKEGRKGKQVELLMLVILFLPGQSISKTCYDIKYPQLSKTTYYLVVAQ